MSVRTAFSPSSWRRVITLHRAYTRGLRYYSFLRSRKFFDGHGLGGKIKCIFPLLRTTTSEGVTARENA